MTVYIAIAAAFAFALMVGVAVGLCIRAGWREFILGCAVIAMIFAATFGVLYLDAANSSQIALSWTRSAADYTVIMAAAIVAMIVSLVTRRIANR